MNDELESIGKWLNTAETANYIGQSIHTIRKWRTKKMRKKKQYDLRPFKRGKGRKSHVHYWTPFLDRWLEQWELIQQSPE